MGEVIAVCKLRVDVTTAPWAGVRQLRAPLGVEGGHGVVPRKWGALSCVSRRDGRSSCAYTCVSFREMLTYDLSCVGGAHTERTGRK